MATMVKKKPKLHRTLPSKLSDLMVLALRDLASVERLKGFVVEMQGWVNYYNDICEVCFSGAVMIHAPEFQKASRHTGDQCWCPSMLPQTEKYYALNFVRCGNVNAALLELYCDSNSHRKRVCGYLAKYPGYEEVIGYREDRKQWKKDMRRIIKQLREFGL